MYAQVFCFQNEDFQEINTPRLCSFLSRREVTLSVGRYDVGPLGSLQVLSPCKKDTVWSAVYLCLPHIWF